MELEDGITVPIVRRLVKYAFNRSRPPPSWETEEGGGRELSTLKAADTELISPQTQGWITVTAKVHQFLIIQRHPRLYANHMFTCTNIVVEIDLNRPFRLLAANVTNVPKPVVRNQSITAVLPHPRFLIPTHITTSEVLGNVQYYW